MNIVDTSSDLGTVDFLAGATLLIDKPKDWTSFDVVNKLRWALRRHLRVKKIKVGHAGTLDPMATGLLIICTGKMTKSIDRIQGLIKEYTGSMLFGVETDSYDAEGQEVQQYDIADVDIDSIEASKEKFVGTIEQEAPIFSALKINGVPSYKLARKGQKPERKKRTITVEKFDIDVTGFPKVDFEVICSKGTYIRSLAHDLGKELNNGAHLIALRREAIGEYRIDDSWDLLKLVEAIDSLEVSTTTES